MTDDEVCWACEPPTGFDKELGQREPGWCSRCGYFFDLHGRRILEPWRTCPVHDPIRSTCPHSTSLKRPHEEY